MLKKTVGMKTRLIFKNFLKFLKVVASVILVVLAFGFMWLAMAEGSCNWWQLILLAAFKSLMAFIGIGLISLAFRLWGVRILEEKTKVQ